VRSRREPPESQVELVKQAIRGAALAFGVKPTQSFLARIIGVHPVQITKWMGRKTRPSFKNKNVLNVLAGFCQMFVREQTILLSRLPDVSSMKGNRVVGVLPMYPMVQFNCAKCPREGIRIPISKTQLWKDKSTGRWYLEWTCQGCGGLNCHPIWERK